MNGLPTARVLSAALTDSPTERLTALFDAHYDRLYRLARRLAPTGDAARDLVQDAFLKTARSLASVPRGAANEEAWLVRVLINIQRDQWRKATVRARYDRDARPLAPAVKDEEAAFVARATVWRAFGDVPPRGRGLVVMHALEDLPVPAIASLLGVTAITVRWHLSRGRRELARILGGDR